MIVVADTSPINYLILIGEIEVLADLFQHVLIPTAVLEELSSDGAPLLVRDWILSRPSWCEVRSVVLEQEVTGVDVGEAEAIVLAKITNSPLIIDDKRVRKLAEELGVQTVGTLGILAQAARAGALILPDAIAKLQDTNFTMSANLVERLLEGSA